VDSSRQGKNTESQSQQPLLLYSGGKGLGRGDWFPWVSYPLSSKRGREELREQLLSAR
jgi:hypothetical protein